MIFLDVPFREKDQAKQLGARWDASSRKWYVPADLADSEDQFKRWLPTSNSTLTDNAQPQLFSEPQAQIPSNKEKGIELSNLLRNIQTALRQALPGAVWVRAEIANLNTRRGHVYLELTQSDAQGKTIASCRAMIWQSQAMGLLKRFEAETGSPLAIGQKILLLAEVSFHEQYGFSIVVQDIDSNYTLGALEKNLSDLRKQLISEGIYQQNRQFVLPIDFFRVAVIAPPDAAGLGDFRADADLLHAQNLCEFSYFYSAFQGEAVQKEMQAAFKAVHALHQSNPFDALVVIRGGGAKLDLHTLNTYPLAKLLCEANLPVITGIGHERDNTILDEVANKRFDTPSKVIGHIRHEIFQQAQQAQVNWKKIEHTSLLSVTQLEQDLTRLNQTILHGSQQALFYWKQSIKPLDTQIRHLSERQLQVKQHRLKDLMVSVEMLLKNRIVLKKMALDQLHQTTQENAQRIVAHKKQTIQQWIALILSSGPKTQLNRGFNIAQNPNTNKPITTAKEALSVVKIELEFVDGCVSAQIETKKGILKRGGST
jgi:exodeoxyribonuclease VII large subunit